MTDGLVFLPGASMASCQVNLGGKGGELTVVSAPIPSTAELSSRTQNARTDTWRLYRLILTVSAFGYMLGVTAPSLAFQKMGWFSTVKITQLVISGTKEARCREEVQAVGSGFPAVTLPQLWPECSGLFQDEESNARVSAVRPGLAL